MKLTVREITEMSMLVALAIVLDIPFLKIKVGANGGSISLTMIPLFILALRFGPLKGFVSIGIVYAFLAFIQDAEPFYSIPFDYILGFGSIAIIGFFKPFIIKEKITLSGILFMCLGVILGCVGRLLSSTISSVLFYKVTFIEGLIYNILYIGPVCGVVLAAMLLLYKPILLVNQRYPLRSIW